MSIPKWLMQPAQKALVRAYRNSLEALYKSGYPTEASLDLQEVRRQDIKDPTLRLAHISDLHIGNHTERKVEDLRRSLLAIQPHFLIISGDLVHYPGAKELGRAREVVKDLAQYAKEVLIVAGNHDRHGQLDLNDWANGIGSGASPTFGCKKFELANGRHVFFSSLTQPLRARTIGRPRPFTTWCRCGAALMRRR